MSNDSATETDCTDDLQLQPWPARFQMFEIFAAFAVFADPPFFI